MNIVRCPQASKGGGLKNATDVFRVKSHFAWG